MNLKGVSRFANVGIEESYLGVGIDISEVKVI